MDEAFHVEVAAVDAEDEGGAWGDGAGVVVEGGLVGGADFAEDGAAGFEDIGDAEAAADLDQFAAGDDDLGAGWGGEVAEDEDEGGGGIIDDGGGGGVGGEGEEVFDVGGAGSAFAGVEVEFEVAVTGGDIGEGEGGGLGEGGAAEVGVEEDAGAVDDRLEAVAGEGGEGGVQLGDERGEVGDLAGCAALVEAFADGVDDDGPGQRGRGERAEESVDGGNGAL